MTRWQQVGIVVLIVGAIAGGGYYMATAGRRQGKRWLWLTPTARTKALAVLAEANRQGLNVMFWDGWRDPQQTLENIAAGTSKVKDAYGSKHTWGVAFDIVFKNPLGLPSWPDKSDPRWQRLGRIGKQLGLRWGGDWYNFQTQKGFFDGPHFELPDFSLVTARTAYGKNYQGWLAYKGVRIPGATQTMIA